jgi:ABC-type transporter Mla subunit MlaD
MLLFFALSVAALLVAVVLSATLLQVRRTLRDLEKRLDETMRQVELTAEDLRRTNAVLRDILTHVERSAANVALVTEGGRRIRHALDTVADTFLDTALPAIGALAGGLAGLRAFVTGFAGRLRGKEEEHV